MAFYEYYREMEAEELNRLTFVTFMIEGCGEFVEALVVMILFAHKVLFNFFNSLLFMGCVVGCGRASICAKMSRLAMRLLCGIY